jgi:hypothetical protein
MQNPITARSRSCRRSARTSRQLSLIVFCDEYLQSQSWQQALDNCSQAVELNPRSVAGHYGRGSALSNLERRRRRCRRSSRCCGSTS